MAEYINRDLALSFPFATGEYDREHADPHFINGCETYREWLEQLPAEDVAEVRHGRWITKKAACVKDYTICSACNAEIQWRDRRGVLLRVDMQNAPYCPHCGARMDEEKDNG